MAGRRNVWHGVRKVCCCLPAEDGVLDPVEPEADSAAASDIPVAPESDGTQVQDLPPQREPQATVVPSENIQAMYQKHIHDLQEDLHTALKNNQELTCQIIEMGHLVFPELSDCTEVSLLERLKVYLECQLKEKQDLEKRTIQAEKAMLEMERTVALLQKHLQDTDNSSTQLAGTVEHHPPVSLPPPLPPLTHTPVRFFFSKIHKESAEKMMGLHLRNQRATSHGEAITSKQKSMNEGQATIRRGVLPKPAAPSGEGLLPQVKEKPTEYKQTFPKTMHNLEAEETTRSCWYLPRSSADDWTHQRDASSDAQVHRDGGSCLNTQLQDGTNALPETNPLSTRSEAGHGILKNPSANPEAHAESPVLDGLALPNEGKHESEGEGVVKGEEEKGSTIGNPVGFIDGTVSQKPNVLGLGASGAKTTTRWNVQVTHPVVGDPVGDDLRKSARSLSACFVHRGDDTSHLESRTSRSLSPKQSLYRDLGLLQKKQEDFSPLPVFAVSAADKEESSLPESAFQGKRADLLYTSTKSLKIQTATKENTHLKGPSAFGKAKDLCISTKDNPVVAVLVDEGCSSPISESSGVAALTSHHTKFPLPSLSAQENTEDLTEAGNLGLEIFL